MTNELATLQHAKEKVVDLSIEYGPRIVAATITMIVGYFVARWITGLFHRWLNKMELEPPVRELLLRLVRGVILLLFLLLALQNLKFELTPVIAGIGVAGAGIAFAMQGVLGNLFAGLTIIFTKPFRVGEYVSMAGVEGRVEAIELFNTKLSHPDMSRIIVPNRKIVGEILHNYGKIRQIEVVVGVAYDTDLNLALSAVTDVLNKNSRVLKEPAPVIRVAMLADSSINIMVAPWVGIPDYGAAIGEVNKAIVEDFRARGVSMPFPQREIRLLNPAA